MAPSWVYYQSDGSNTDAAQKTHDKAVAMATLDALFVYGGDVYDGGSDANFDTFKGIYGDVLSRLAETAGNHDWYVDGAKGYETFWLAHPESRTPIDRSKRGPSGHHYTQDLGNGWLGIFIDCGYDAETGPTTAALDVINDWINTHGLRSIIVFLHHARLSRGVHDDNRAMDLLWQLCFDEAGAPRVAAWVAGHNHNMGIYKPRAKGTGFRHPPPVSEDPAKGVYIFINGAGGADLYDQHIPEGPQCVACGTAPDFFHDDLNHGFLRIELRDSGTAVFQNFSTGPHGNATSASAIEEGEVTISLTATPTPPGP